MSAFLPVEHRILDKGCLEHRPFGVRTSGERIRDVSGVVVCANVDHLEEVVGRSRGAEAGRQAVEDLCRLLNERIRDPAYHVTPAFLRNVWQSYSYEFAAFLGEFCILLSGQADFQSAMASEKFLSPLVQTLARPFSVAQIYRMFPHFGEKFAKGSLHFEVGMVTEGKAVLRMRLAEHVALQFGPYRRACARLICDASKAGLAAVPRQVHHLPPAAVADRACMAQGDEQCEWEFRWDPQDRRRMLARAAGPAAATVAGGLAFGYLRARHPAISLTETFGLALFPAGAAWLASVGWGLLRALRRRERLVQEQLRSVEHRHEELREAYLQQGETAVELKQKLAQLTALHRTGLLFSSTLDRETLLQAVLRALRVELHYDRAMVAAYDPERRVAQEFRILGVPDELAGWVRSQSVPITDPDTVEGEVLLQGRPVLIPDVRRAWTRLHPFTRRLAEATGARAFLSVPLKVKDRVIGALTVDRTDAHGLTRADLDLMVTVAGQVAIALENAGLYDELDQAFEGFVRASVTAIESRDPVTSGHSHRVALLTCGLAEAVDRLETGPFAGIRFAPDRMKEIRYAALLHDFGKVGVREPVLLKAEKLYPDQLTALRGRFEVIKTSLEVRALRQKLALAAGGDRQGTAARMAEIDAALARQVKETDEILAFLLQCNRPTVMEEGGFDRLLRIASMIHEAGEGSIPYLTREEAAALSIRRGSLTPADRREIETHVTATYAFLCAIPWSRSLKQVPLIAYGHHEKLDGGGYPRGLAATDIPVPTRIMTISDIYDALTAGDRPYKKGVSPHEALDILHGEARAGKVDADLLQVFVEARVYDRISGSPSLGVK